MNKYTNIIVIIIFLISLGVQAQVVTDKTIYASDTLVNLSTKLPDQLPLKQKPDSMRPNSLKSGSLKPDSLKPVAFKPDPIKVVWMGAIIPGYGQIMNRKYWKLPIVYGGFLGCGYAITMNSSRYKTYLTAYRDIIDTDPSTNSFLKIIPRGYTIESYGGISVYTNLLKSAQENYRRYRDLSIILSVGYYALTLVDAYVDAQLYDFDISPDLTMRFRPALLPNRFGIPDTLGMRCSFSLK